MRKIHIVLSIVLITLILIIIFNFLMKDKYVIINGERIEVEVAKTFRERERGLMYQEDLCKDCGMLFVFEEEDFHDFWMKNTLLPLDMIFINSKLEVIDVLHTQPCEADPCELYSSEKKALYVLETNQDRFNEDVVGEKVKLEI